MYEYKVLEIISIYDGDTCKLKLDLGFNIHSIQTIRLNGINAPEIRGDEREQGLISRDWLRERMKDKELHVLTMKDKKGKYGRLLGEIFEAEHMMSINQQMILEGLATKY